jgi:hypothetical protein
MENPTREQKREKTKQWLDKFFRNLQGRYEAMSEGSVERFQARMRQMESDKQIFEKLDFTKLDIQYPEYN